MVGRTGRAARRWLVAVVLLVSCVDGPGAPGHLGELRFRPTYIAGDEPSSLAVAIDSAVVRVTRPAEPGAAMIDTTVAYRTDTASFAWILELQAESESLRVDVSVWGGGKRFYDGGDKVLVSDGALAAPVTEPVDVVYVGPPIVATVTVSPTSVTLEAIDAIHGLAAEARGRDGAVIPDAAIAWASDNEAVVRVDPSSGVITAVANGTAMVSASSGNSRGDAAVVVQQRVTEIAVNPPAITLTALGATLTLAGEARDANGHAVAGAELSWASDAPHVASVDPTTGRVTAMAGGSATITATSAGVTGTAVVTVNPIADVATIDVSPSVATLTARDATRQYTAVARDAGGKVLEGVQFTWASSVVDVATIDAVSGLARAVGHGTTTVTASAGAAVGTASLTVDLSSTIVSVHVSPATAALEARGATQQFTAVARDAGGNIVPVAAFDWTSTQPTVATVDGTGLATAAGHGTTAIRATVIGVTGEATLTVDLTLTVTTVHVSPGATTLASLGATQQFTAEARDGGGQVVLGVPFVWSSSAPTVGEIDPATGFATAKGHGVTTITATTGTVTGSASLTVDLEPVVASVLVSPATATVTAVNATQLFTAVARDAQGAVLPGVLFTWTSSVPAVATINADGLASAVSHGTTIITATAGSTAGTATLTVDFAETIATVHVSPATAELEARGATQQFTAVARDAGGNVVPVAAFDWTSTHPTVASVDGTGLATAAGHGTTAIRATVAGVTGEATLTVDLTATVTTVHVSPGAATLASLGATQQFTAEARDAGGQLVLGVPFVWISSAPVVGEIDPATGIATAKGHGVTTITATTGTVTGSASLSVDLGSVVATVVVSPAVATLTAVDATQLFTAVARDAQGTVLPGVPFTWTSSVPAVATIATDGLASAVRHGTTVIMATAGSKAGTATLTVDLGETIATVHVSPATAALETRGAMQQFVAEARDASGGVVPVAAFSWTSTQPNVATVDGTTGLATAVGHGTTAIRATVAGVTGEASLTVDLTVTVASVHVSPPVATLSSLGATQQFTAEARDAGGQVVVGVPFVWISSSSAVATIDPIGLATATGHGVTTITATTGTVTGSASLSVDLEAVVTTVVVSPATATLTAVNATQLFTAVARDAQGTVMPGVPFTWTSSAPTVATVNATGLATAAGHGTTAIRATVAGVTGEATLTVDLTVTVTTVHVNPPEVTLTSLGATQQFTAEARDAGGQVVPGVPFVWSSSAPAVATIDPIGLATATGHGVTTITATTGTVSGSASLTVDLEALVASVVVSPAVATLTAVDATQLFTAVARDAQGTVLPGVSFNWTSSVPAVATIAVDGRASAVSHGTTVITATAGSTAGTATLTVDLRETIASVHVSPATAELESRGATQQFTAVARDAGGNIVPVAAFTWTSTQPTVATVDGTTGLATAVGHGSTAIRATVAGVTGEASLTVDLTVTVTTVHVNPPEVTLTSLGATQQFTAEARDASGQVVLGVPFTWSSSAPAVGEIDPASGLATATGAGSARITATTGTATGNAALTVNLTTSVASIDVSPAEVTLTTIGAVQQFTAIARDASGTPLPGVSFAWSSSIETVASVDATGRATAAGHGTTTVTASANGISDFATLTVDLSTTIATIEVSPASATLTSLGATQQFTAVARDANGAMVPLNDFAWSSSAPEIATVGSTGLATARRHGLTTIVAAAGGKSGSASLSVDLRDAIAAIVVTPAAATLEALGATQAFHAEARDANGGVIPGVTFVWTSGNTTVASIDPGTGVATAVANGTATITATAGTVSGTATLTVQQRVASVVVTPATATLKERNRTQQFTAQALDANGRVVVGVTFTWSSSNTAVATVNANGLATSRGFGTAQIRATTAGITGSAVLTVQDDE